MDSKIWSRLPDDITGCIIDNTSDTETLSSWCEATRHNLYLYRIAFKRSWESITIYREDLGAPVPIDLHDDLATGPFEDWNKPYRKLPKLMRRDHRGIIPASVVRFLYLDFIEHPLNFSEHASSRTIPFPEPEGKKYWLPLICPHLTGVQHVQANGNLRQSEMAFIRSLPSSKIWSLGLRACDERIELQEQRERFYLPIREFRFGLPCKAQILRSLDIRVSKPWEAIPLADAVMKLKHLAELTITSCCFSAGEPPLFSFLNRLFPDSKNADNHLTLIEFPAHLSHLKLIEGHLSVTSTLLHLCIFCDLTDSGKASTLGTSRLFRRALSRHQDFPRYTLTFQNPLRLHYLILSLHQVHYQNWLLAVTLNRSSGVGRIESI